MFCSSTFAIFRQRKTTYFARFSKIASQFFPGIDNPPVGKKWLNARFFRDFLVCCDFQSGKSRV